MTQNWTELNRILRDDMKRPFQENTFTFEIPVLELPADTWREKLFLSAHNKSQAKF